MTLSPSMHTITLPGTTLTLPALGIGTWAWGDSVFWDYGKGYTEADLAAAFEGAIAAGVTLFDTAEIYGFGESERLLGRFIQRLAPTQRAKVAIASKYFPLPWRFSPRAVAQALEASLQRLQRDTLEVYQIHWPFEFFLGQRPMVTALGEAVRQGRVQAVGVSNYSAAQMATAHAILAEMGVPLAVNQVQYSLLHRTIESNGVLAKARELGVVILAYSPLAQGLLTGKYRAEQPLKPAGARGLSSQFKPAALAQREPLFQALDTLGQTYGKTPAQVALNWLIQVGNVVPIPGAKTAQQATQNAGALGWALSPEDWATLERLGQPQG